MAERSRKDQSPPLHSKRVGCHSVWHATAFLACVWAGSLFYGEVLAFRVSAWTCSWPSLSTDPNADASSKTLKVAVIADPQLTDRTTHGMRPDSFALKATQFYSDIYMRRAFRNSVMTLLPDEIIFLGDYFDGGPSLSEAEFDASVERFWHIFDQSNRGSRSRPVRAPCHFLFGNHDLGYAGLQSERPELLQRYERVFGRVEHMDKIGAVSFVFVDSQSLDGDPNDIRSKNAWSFIKNISAEENSEDSKVLLSHIPLFRPDNTPCGALRSSEVINQRITWSRSSFKKIMYQNYLSEAATIQMLERLRPVLVLSGHDHDQCSVKHRTSSLSVIEHTIGSFSWQNGNLYPSFFLLTVNAQRPLVAEGILSSRLCFLPYQTHIYIWYAGLFMFSLITLLSWPSHGIDLHKILSVFKPHDVAKAKDEDALYDYEMVWDAEGSMHLIRKSSGPSEYKYRNQAAARSTALAQSLTKRTMTSDPSTEVTLSTEQTVAESYASSEGRSSRNTIGFIVRRLKLAIGPIVALTTMNASLYVMMLMNDWTGL